jgi:hypothetical protein
VNDALQRRVRRHRSRLVVRAWEYRQRNLAHGVWFRLRRELADAARAFVIDPEHAHRLVAAGARLATVGDELLPPRPIVVLAEDQAHLVEDARELRVALSAELLSAPALALVRFARTE